MKTNPAVDSAKLSLLLTELRLPAIQVMWPQFAEQADKEGWPAARFLAAITEHELAERDRRRIERHLAEARLLPGKTLDTFEFEAVPMISKAQVMAITAGDSWLEKGANLLLFGPPGGGKSHLASAIGLALIETGWRVMFTRTTDLVQKLQVARRELGLEAAINRLDRFHLLILDDLAYVTKDQAQSALRRMGEGLPRSRHDARRGGSPRPSRHNLRAECRELSAARGHRAKAGARQAAVICDTHERRSLIDAPRQSNRQDLLRATIHAAIIATAATPDSHPDCRALLSQIVAL